MKVSEDQSMNPYPKHLITQHILSDGAPITIRPVRLDDSEIIKEFGRNLSSELKHLNYMENFRELPKNIVTKLIQIDYKKSMTLIATHQKNGKEIVIGMVHYVTEPDGKSCEFDMIVTDAWQNKGIGSQLTKALLIAAKENGIKSIKIIILASNIGGLMLAKNFDFVISNSDDPTVYIVTKNL